MYCLDCTYSTLIYEQHTAHFVLMNVLALEQQVARAPHEPIPRLIPIVEEVQGAEPGAALTLTKARLQISSVPHAVAVKSGWDVEGFYPKDYFDIRESWRLKQVSCLHLRNATGFPELVAKNQPKAPAKSRKLAPAPAPIESGVAAPAPVENPQTEISTNASNKDTPDQKPVSEVQTDLVVSTPLAETTTTTQLELKAIEETKEVKAKAKAKAHPDDDRKTDVERRMAEAKRLRNVAKAETATKRASGLITLDGPAVHRSRAGRGRAR